MKTWTSTLLIVGWIAGCASTVPPPQPAAAQGGASTATIEGTATYRERSTLPPTAVFEATLEDVSQSDARSIEIARTSITQPPAPPIAFTIPFDAGKIDRDHRYSVRARILVDGAVWFTSDTAQPVLTAGSGRTAHLLLKRPGQQLVAAAELAELLGGEMTYLADAARFTNCADGRSYPVAMEADFEKLQKAYLASVRKPGGRLYVTFDGLIADRPRMEGTGFESTMVVSRYVGTWPNQDCERSRTDAPLFDTEWRIVALTGLPIMIVDGRHLPQLQFTNADGSVQYSATVGCNRMSGAVKPIGRKISFAPGASTLMGCPPPLDAMERELGKALAATRRYAPKGNTLELRDETGAQTILCEAAPR